MNEREPRMDTNEQESKLIELSEINRSISKEEIILKDEVYAIVGCAIEVLNFLGHGFHEKPYENALTIEFNLREIPYQQQPSFDISYKKHKVGQYVPDLIVYDSVIVDTKVIDRVTDREKGQMINYLNITSLRVGVILNFSNPKLEWERIIL